MRSKNERQPAVVASTCISLRCNYTYITHIYSIYIYIYLFMYSLYFITIPKVRNKTNYETPSFHTSGTARNVPYTILTHSHIYIYASYFELYSYHLWVSYFSILFHEPFLNARFRKRAANSMLRRYQDDEPSYVEQVGRHVR